MSYVSDHPDFWHGVESIARRLAVRQAEHGLASPYDVDGLDHVDWKTEVENNADRVPEIDSRGNPIRYRGSARHIAYARHILLNRNIDPDLRVPKTPEQENRYHRYQTRRQHVVDVSRETGTKFEGRTLYGEPSLRLVPPARLAGKGTVIVDFSGAPFLSDQEAVKNAISKALSRVTQGIQADVTNTHIKDFADVPSPGKSFPKDYSSGDAYYSSGMIPVWRGQGGLVGSFKVIPAQNRLMHSLAFTAPHASLIENGGVALSQPNEQWFIDRQIGKRQIYTIHKHAYMSHVAQTIYDNLDNYGHLQTFADIFVETFKH